MPLHQGHIALIRFARAHCDELIVSMSYKSDDPIDGPMRFRWLQEFFANDPTIIPAISMDDFDQTQLPLAERVVLWAAFIKKRFPPVDVLFSSEDYGEPFAAQLGIAHMTFDPQREKVPVSSTKIRTQPFAYWSFIPANVRPYFVKIICFFGAESTGKSTMARRFAEIYQTSFVPEVAREMISSNVFSVDDIIRIGHAQTARVKEKRAVANRLLFCDTDLVTTSIYSKKYLGVVPEILTTLEKEIQYDQYFLFDVDVPWVADGLRDLKDERGEMSQAFEQALVQRHIPFIRVAGNWAEREGIIRSALKANFGIWD